MKSTILKIRDFTGILAFATMLLFNAAYAGDKAKEFTPDDEKGPDIGAAPTETSKAADIKDIKLKSTQEFVPDDEKGPDIGAAPTEGDSSGKSRKTAAKEKTAREFVPDDDKGPDIGAAPTK